MKPFIIPGLLIALIAPGSGHAWEEGSYIGFGIGSTKYDIGAADYDDGTIVSGSVDRSDSGYKFFGGYRFNPNMALEFYIADLGDTTFQGQSAADINDIKFWCPGRAASRVQTDGFGFSALGNAPLRGGFNLYGKVGMFLWDMDAIIRDSCGTFWDSDSGTDLMYGVGVSYQVNYLSTVQVEWERYTNILDNYNVDFLSLGLSFSLYY